MQNIFILIGIGLLVLMVGMFGFITLDIRKNIREMARTITHQYNLVMKLQSALKNKTATNAVTENAEMIYQDLLQKLIPVMAAIDVMPRVTTEHPLWRALGGIMDEYAKNPFILENLRRKIKLDPEIARNIDGYIARADAFLNYLSTNDGDGILTATFTDGLLGQSVTFFAQAKQLAATHNE